MKSSKATLIALGPLQIVIFWAFGPLEIPSSFDLWSVTRSPKKKKRYMHLEKERKIETNGTKCKEIEKKKIEELG